MDDELQKREVFVLLDQLVLLPHDVRAQLAAAYDDAAAGLENRATAAVALRVASSRRNGIVMDQGVLNELDAALEGRAESIVDKVRRTMYRAIADQLWHTVGGRPNL